MCSSSQVVWHPPVHRYINSRTVLSPPLMERQTRTVRRVVCELFGVFFFSSMLIYVFIIVQCGCGCVVIAFSRMGINPVWLQNTSLLYRCPQSLIVPLLHYAVQDTEGTKLELVIGYSIG